MRWAEHAEDPGPAADVLRDDTYPKAADVFNVADLLLNGAPDRAVYIEDNQVVSLADVRAIAAGVAGTLVDAGVGEGARVLLRLHDSPELAGSMLAVFSLGAIAIPTFTQYGAEELRYRVEDAAVTAVLVDRSLVDAARDAVGALPVAVLVLAPGGRGAIDGHENHSLMLRPADTRADDLALILYTSGSTGNPKGTCHSHADLLAVCDAYGAGCLELRDSDLVVGAAAMPFALGFALFFLYPLRFGCVAVLDADKSPDRCLELIEQHTPTLLVGVATYYAMLLNSLAARTAPDFNSLRGCLTGGERVTESLSLTWQQQTGQVLTQFLGTTEMLGCFIGGKPGAPAHHRAIGPPVQGYEVVVREPETFEPVRDGVHGVLTVRGPTSTKYWKRPEKQREAVRFGWNAVPDIVFTTDGLVHFVARQDDVIKSAGFRISPGQVEEVLGRHPSVAECACIGAPDPQGVRPEVIKACIVLRDPYVPTDELKAQLQAFVRSCAAPYLYPRVVEFVESLPRTASGKLQRSALRARS
jgi:2-aminobenzoate-CoA ligase